MDLSPRDLRRLEIEKEHVRDSELNEAFEALSHESSKIHNILRANLKDVVNGRADAGHYEWTLSFRKVAQFNQSEKTEMVGDIVLTPDDILEHPSFQQIRRHFNTYKIFVCLADNPGKTEPDKISQARLRFAFDFPQSMNDENVRNTAEQASSPDKQDSDVTVRRNNTGVSGPDFSSPV